MSEAACHLSMWWPPQLTLLLLLNSFGPLSLTGALQLFQAYLCSTQPDPVRTFYNSTWLPCNHFFISGNCQYLTPPSLSIDIENSHCHFGHPAFSWPPNTNDMYLTQYAPLWYLFGPKKQLLVMSPPLHVLSQLIPSSPKMRWSYCYSSNEERRRTCTGGMNKCSTK